MRQLGPSHRSQPAAPLLNSLVAILLKHKGMSKGLFKFHALLAFCSGVWALIVSWVTALVTASVGGTCGRL